MRLLSKSDDYAKASNCIVGIRPYKYEEGMKIAEEFIRTLRSGAYSFEIWSDGKKNRVFMCSSEPSHALKRKIMAFYPTAELYDAEEIFPFQDRDLSEVEVAKIVLKKVFYPIRSDFSDDPLNALLAVMSEHELVYQVTFKPAPPKYVKAIVGASRYEQSEKVVGLFNPKIVKPSEVEKNIGKALAGKAKEPLYSVDIRLCAVGELAEEVIYNTQGFFELFTFGNYGFEIKLIRGLTSSGTLKKREKILRDMIERRCYGTCILSASELCTLAHIPGKEISLDLDWTTERKDVYIPEEEITHQT